MSYSSGNLNYAFNVEYYSMSPEDANCDIVKIHVGEVKCRKGEKQFELQTCYPGLLIGIGNFHGGAEKGELDGGFSLDYVTGAPYIPASSLKGVLRSAFEHEEYIREMLGDNSVDVKALEEEIFEGKRNGAEIPMYERDVFFDAYPETVGKIMGIESITPHDGEFKSPNPLSFLKVLPNVVFCFSFNLHDSVVCKVATADKKRDLFKDIIKDFGVGAKTNVGFGAFEDKNDKKSFKERQERQVQHDSKPREKKPAAVGSKVGVSKVFCPKCGAPNFKYKKDTEILSYSWRNKKCRINECGADLTELIEKVEM